MSDDWELVPEWFYDIKGNLITRDNIIQIHLDDPNGSWLHYSNNNSYFVAKKIYYIAGKLQWRNVSKEEAE